MARIILLTLLIPLGVFAQNTQSPLQAASDIVAQFDCTFVKTPSEKTG